jgi:hypothetical protein
MLLYEKKNEEILLIKSEVLKRTRYEGEKYFSGNHFR